MNKALFRPASLVLLAALLTLTACGGGRFSTPYAAGYSVSEPISCVPFAREESGFQIRGDAWTWWDQAPPRYARGKKPEKGAVMVFARTQKLRRGHVAVVTRVIDNRQIDLTHSNWGGDRDSRSVVYERQRAQDISPANDWSLVKLWNHEAQTFGNPYPAYGFIYQ